MENIQVTFFAPTTLKQNRLPLREEKVKLLADLAARNRWFLRTTKLTEKVFVFPVFIHRRNLNVKVDVRLSIDKRLTQWKALELECLKQTFIRCIRGRTTKPHRSP